MASTKKLIELLVEYVSENKQNKIKEVLENRTRYLTIVLEDIFQPHNANATLRTAECLGIQDIHIIENRNEFDLHGEVSQGSSKWLSILRYNEIPPARTERVRSGGKPKSRVPNTISCLKSLKKQGYKIAVTSLSEDCHTPADIPLDNPLALVFGTEKHGVTDTAISLSDYKLKIPMFGFTQSYNISVSVAIALSTLTKRIREYDSNQKSKLSWQLTDQQKEELTLEWYKRCVKSSEQLIRRFSKN